MAEATKLDRPPAVRMLFCDDVRQEMGNKHSLMGVYGDSLCFVGSTAVLPKFVPVAQVDLPASMAGVPIAIEILDHDNVVVQVELKLGSVPGTASQPLPDPRLTERLVVTIPTEMVGFEMRDGMVLRMRTTLGDSTPVESEPLRVIGLAAPAG